MKKSYPASDKTSEQKDGSESKMSPVADSASLKERLLALEERLSQMERVEAQVAGLERKVESLLKENGLLECSILSMERKLQQRQAPPSEDQPSERPER